jgi:hypothetical protein
MNTHSFTRLLSEIRACTVCEGHLEHVPRPIVQAGSDARIVIIGQAPGRRATSPDSSGTTQAAARCAAGSVSPANSSTTRTSSPWYLCAFVTPGQRHRETIHRDPHALRSGMNRSSTSCLRHASRSSSPLPRSATSSTAGRHSPTPLPMGCVPPVKGCASSPLAAQPTMVDKEPVVRSNTTIPVVQRRIAEVLVQPHRGT